MPAPQVNLELPINKNYIHYLGSSAKDTTTTGEDLRSVTPKGFALAVFEANKP